MSQFLIAIDTETKDTIVFVDGEEIPLVRSGNINFYTFNDETKDVFFSYTQSGSNGEQITKSIYLNREEVFDIDDYSYSLSKELAGVWDRARAKVNLKKLFSNKK